MKESPCQFISQHLCPIDYLSALLLLEDEDIQHNSCLCNEISHFGEYSFSLMYPTAAVVTVFNRGNEKKP